MSILDAFSLHEPGLLGLGIAFLVAPARRGLQGPARGLPGRPQACPGPSGPVRELQDDAGAKIIVISSLKVWPSSSMSLCSMCSLCIMCSMCSISMGSTHGRMRGQRVGRGHGDAVPRLKSLPTQKQLPMP